MVCPFCEGLGDPILCETHTNREHAACRALIADLAAALREQLDAEERRAIYSSAAFERAAEAFYRDTHMLAPGKDQPAGLPYSDEERRAAWEQWTMRKLTERHARWKHLLTRAEGTKAAVGRLTRYQP